MSSVLRVESKVKKPATPVVEEEIIIEKGKLDDQVYEKTKLEENKKTVVTDVAVARNIAPSNFTENVLQFVTARLPLIYCASLIVTAGYCNYKKVPSKLTSTVLTSSLKLAAYYTVLVFLLACLWKLPDRIFISLGWFVIVPLIWVAVCYYNLYFTAAGFLFTWLKRLTENCEEVDEFGDPSCPPEQTLVNQLLDTRLSRGNRTFTDDGAAAGVLAAGVGEKIGGSVAWTTRFSFFFTNTFDWFRGAGCTNSWGGGFPDLLYTEAPSLQQFSDNFAGKLAWQVEELVVKTAGANCTSGMIGFARVFNLFNGLVMADAFFQYVLEDSVLPDSYEQTLRKEVYRLASNPWDGLVCKRNDFANLISAYVRNYDPEKSKNQQEFYAFDRSLEMKRVRRAFNAVEGSWRNWQKKKNKGDLVKTQPAVELSENDIRSLDTRYRNEVQAEYNKLLKQDDEFLVEMNKVDFFNTYRSELSVLGLNLVLLVKAVAAGQLIGSDLVPREHMLYMFGQEATIDGIVYGRQPVTVNRLRVTLNSFPDANTYCGSGETSPCCAPNTRAFDLSIPVRFESVKGFRDQFLGVFFNDVGNVILQQDKFK